jgi:hypothetical protein
MITSKLSLKRTINLSPRQKFGQPRSRRAENLSIYGKFQRIGCNYIWNLNTGELHRVESGGLCGSHNLVYANLNDFIGITNIGFVPIHSLPDGDIFPLYEQDTCRFIGNYRLNKCKHCFSKRMNRFV